MSATIKVKRGGGTPSGLTFGEPAFDTTSSKLFIGVTASQIWVGAEIDADTTLAANSAIKIPTQQAVKSYVASQISANTAGVSTLTAGVGITLSGSTGDITITNTGVQSLSGTSNQISISGPTGEVTLSLPSTLIAPGSLAVTTDLTVSGNLIVNGTTTTVNSDVTTIDDPMLVLGTSGGVPIAASDGGKDRGIALSYFDGAVGRTGFFGLDASTTKFTYIPIATITGDIVTAGSVGDAQFKSLYLTTDNTNIGGLTLATLDAARTYVLPNHSGSVVVPSDLGTNGYILKGSGVASQPTWIDPIVSGFTAYAATRLNIARTITLGTDLSGSVDFDGSSNVTLNATIAANSVALGDDTTGNYVRTLTTASPGLTLLNSGAESADVTVNLQTLTSGLNMGLFTFQVNEFINTDGTITHGLIDGGAY